MGEDVVRVSATGEDDILISTTAMPDAMEVGWVIFTGHDGSEVLALHAEHVRIYGKELLPVPDNAEAVWRAFTAWLTKNGPLESQIASLQGDLDRARSQREGAMDSLREAQSLTKKETGLDSVRELCQEVRELRARCAEKESPREEDARP